MHRHRNRGGRHPFDLHEQVGTAQVGGEVGDLAAEHRSAQLAHLVDVAGVPHVHLDRLQGTQVGGERGEVGQRRTAL
jgi:hypothetical protein